ncbi:MAG: D-alanyl-D-alanine carboxypeptidase family protein [Bacillota bacterium]
MFKKIVIISLTVCLVCLISFGVIAQEIPDPEFDLEAESAVLMEAKSGRILYEKNPHQELPPASITKVMTLLLTMEALEEGRVSLDDVVVTSEEAAKMGGSQIWLEPGEEMTLQEMIKAIAIVSANDACVAVAEHIYGTSDGFVNAMNRKAKELGLKNTHFINTNGLPPEDSQQRGNYTSAYDVALMSQRLVNRYPQVLKHTQTWIDELRDGESFLRNTNNLVRFYRGADGLKTGYTSEAGFGVTATAQRNGLRFIAVVMREDDSKIRFNEASELLSYGFSIYRSIPVVKEGEVVLEQLEVYKGKDPLIKAVAKADLNAAVIKGSQDELKRQIAVKRELVAPLEKGAKLGELRVLAGEEVIAKVDLVSNRQVEKGNPFQIIKQLVKKFLVSLMTLFKIN